MEIYGLQCTCSTCPLLCLAASQTRASTFEITRQHISSVFSPHVSTIRVLSSMIDAGYWTARSPKQPLLCVLSRHFAWTANRLWRAEAQICSTCPGSPPAARLQFFTNTVPSCSKCWWHLRRVFEERAHCLPKRAQSLLCVCHNNSPPPFPSKAALLAISATQ